MTELAVAVISGGVSIAGAIFAWLQAHRLERMKAEIAKDAATHASALQVASQRQLEVFRLAAQSTEEAARVLLTWVDALKDYSAFTVTRGGDAFKTDGETMRGHGRAAAQVGLFVPPALDEPLRAAVAALSVATDAVSKASIAKGQGHEPEAIIDKHYRGKEAAEKAVAAFVEKAREWKVAEWPLSQGAELGRERV